MGEGGEVPAQSLLVSSSYNSPAGTCSWGMNKSHILITTGMPQALASHSKSFRYPVKLSSRKQVKEILGGKALCTLICQRDGVRNQLAMLDVTLPSVPRG